VTLAQLSYAGASAESNRALLPRRRDLCTELTHYQNVGMDQTLVNVASATRASAGRPTISRVSRTARRAKRSPNRLVLVVPPTQSGDATAHLVATLRSRDGQATMSRSREVTTHFNSQSTDTPEGDRRELHDRPPVYTEDGERKIMAASQRYLDNFIKIDGWYFAERKLILGWNETRSFTIRP
jgi:hypothetical protein